MQSILVIEDDAGVRNQVVNTLSAAGYEVRTWSVGHHVRADAVPDVHLVVLDLGLPEVPGLTILQELRAASDIPVLVLSTRADAAQRVQALELGADDYLVKPFWPEELLARVAARLRRPVIQRADHLEVGPLVLHPRERTATMDGVLLDLTPLEFEFLCALARKPGEAVSRAWLVHNVLDPDRDGSERTLDTHASRLRKKLGKPILETVWGVGYRLVRTLP